MGKNGKMAAWIVAGLALSAVLIVWLVGDDETTATTTEGTAAAQPDAVGGTQTLELGQPAVALAVPIPPGFSVSIATPGEYEISVGGAPMDPEMFLYRGDEIIEHDDDGGEGLDSRIVTFLAAGTYSLRILERRARPYTAQVLARRLEPLTPVGTVTLGQPLQVQLPRYPPRERPRNLRDASKAVTFQVASAGRYTCTAAAPPGKDPLMSLIQDGVVLTEDDDSGEGQAASITEELAPGSYIIRVWDWPRRGEMTITVTCDAG